MSKLQIDLVPYTDWRDTGLSDAYSLYSLLDRYYKAKKAYYLSGKILLTDEAFDALEDSIRAIHGGKALEMYGCVGYDAERHEAISKAAYYYQSLFMRLFNER